MGLTRLAIIAVVVVAVVTAAVYYFVVVAPQPKITITDSTYTTSGCGAFGSSHYTYAWTFSLVNSGDADGFATVKFYVVQNVEVAQNTYFVPAHSYVTKTGPVNSPDCTMTYYPYLSLASVVKA